MDQAGQNLKKPRRGPRRLVILGWIVGLIVVFYAQEDWRGWHAWHQFQKEWEAKGEKFGRQPYIPPPVPDDQNFALTPIVFTSYGGLLTRDGKEIPVEKRDTNFVNRMQMQLWAEDRILDSGTNYTGDWRKAETSDLTCWQGYYRTLATITNLFPVAAQPQSPAQDVLLALSKYDATIEELRTAAKLPASRFPIEYDKELASDIILPHLAGIRSSTRILQMRAIAELQANRTSQALADVKLMLRLADSIRSEPFLISQLVRTATINLAIQPIYDGLASRQWSKAQLVELDSILATEDSLSDYKLALRGDLNFLSSANLEYWRRCPWRLTYFSETNPPLVAKALCSFIPSGVFYQNQVHCARATEEYLVPMADVTEHVVSLDSVSRGRAAIAAETRNPTAYNIFERLLMPAEIATINKFAQAQNALDMARTAIALENYRMVYGEFPNELNLVSPLPDTPLPHDVINGEPLEYRRETKGQFVLYSIGWNGTDDGGVVALKTGTTPSVDFTRGDWVWKYPAK